MSAVLDNGITVLLTRPIQAHGEEVTALTFREPTPKDLMESGSPVLLIPSAEGDMGIEVRPKVIALYIARLGGIPPSSVHTLCVADFMACQGALLPFLQGG